MRIYRFFLVMPYREKISLETRFNFNIPFLYNEKTDLCLMLYAWTNDKDKKEEFIKFRSNKFKVSSINVDDDKYNKFRREFINQKLDYYKIRQYNEKKEKYKDIEILMTRQEYTILDEDLGVVFGSLIEPYVSSDYIYFKYDFIEALDILLYTTYHSLWYSRDEGESDYIDYNMSYDMTPGGYSFSEILESIDQLVVFLKLFSPVLK